jgi:hypothetical protein
MKGITQLGQSVDANSGALCGLVMKPKTNSQVTNSTASEVTKSAANGLDEFFAGLRKVREAGRKAVESAEPAMERLARVLCDRSGQPYKLRALLYSLYNGQPTSLLEVVGLDRAIRADLCAVILAFGYEEPAPGKSFFYKEMKAAIDKVGQWEWFIEAHKGEEE